MPLTLELTDTAARALARLATLQGRSTGPMELQDFGEHLLAEVITEKSERAESIARAVRAHKQHDERAT